MGKAAREEEGSREVEIKDFDDVLKHIGGWGPFQLMITGALFPFNLFLGYVYLSPILTLFAPPHWCNVPALAHLPVDQRQALAIPRTPSGEFDKCSEFLVDWSQVGNISLDSEAVPDFVEVGGCRYGWEYDIDNFHRSAVTDNDWVCQMDWVPALSQSIFFLGAVPGMLLYGWLSDHHGRVPAILLSNLVTLITGLALPFANGFLAFCTLRFIMGTAFNTFFIIPYTLAIEYVEDSKRVVVGNLGLAFCLTLSGALQPPLIRALGDWRLFNWLIFSQMLFVVVLPIFIPESCRWLMSRGEGERSVAIMKRIAKMNKKEVPDRVYSSVLKLCEKKKKEAEMDSLSYLDLFRTGPMRRVILTTTLMWTMISLVFDCTVRNITNLSFSIYKTFAISAALEFPADLLSIVGLEVIGRRYSAALSMIMVFTFTLPCAWLADLPTSQAVLSMAARFAATYAINTGFQFSVEVLPTSLRSQGMAIVHLTAMLSLVASPLIVYSESLSVAAPWIIISLLALLAALPGLWLPETAGISLPDTVEDMEAFARKGDFFRLPDFARSRGPAPMSSSSAPPSSSSSSPLKNPPKAKDNLGFTLV